MLMKGEISTINVTKRLISVVFRDYDSTISASLPLISSEDISTYKVNDIVVAVFFASNMSDGVILGKIGGV